MRFHIRWASARQFMTACLLAATLAGSAGKRWN
jgi:hypothetical protein